ncbi:hypothetical protein A6723_021080 [Pseudomonas sp. AU11447]|uniref:hypothetical protein n=1 Tax=Pseudomonas sp. AU11447 TaxID=1843184 RepID=UPI0007ED8F12|nr:hypothetical protein [Pseudomonas sp. AU11447]OBY90722.1 hypothetical protein A6723_021080 [Pseudomonas sp. AU11447]
MAARNSKQQLCVVTLGYQRFLLPQADALKFIDIMSRAAEVERDYSGDAFKFIVGEAPEADLSVVRPGQLVMPQAAAAPVTPRSGRKSPAQLSHQPFLLEGK